MNTTFKNGEKIFFSSDDSFAGIGFIRGLAFEYPYSTLWIVERSTDPSDSITDAVNEYPFSCFLLDENRISKI